MTHDKLLFLDCDSTLSAIEGVDELARYKGESTFAEVKSLTDQAMDGTIAIDEIFARRLDVIRPTRSDCAAVGQLYVRDVEATALETVKAAQTDGWKVIILSGGFTDPILPLAHHLGIDTVEAVPLIFDDNGNYVDFDHDAPTTRNGGKPEVIARYKAANPDAKVVMVGDGVSDLEAQDVADIFIGFGGFAKRPAVVKGSKHFVDTLSDILALLP
ncbi:HAD-IB family phosphatase [Sulfuriroseicoccus oceanibius]|uniref:phosphoserine phosphatase n=1 Tax=Sulfuriroseicoccus oceanibius TaxID=2707525 RepID=A0A6B3L3B1_9BACT|nr:HAD-IB family phosphatase [Sulfuriroseicoccus oceanibius]QQL45924.1 HAD-IB family phosphatase [Sulfuriroseicoccus oceanibius]